MAGSQIRGQISDDELIAEAKPEWNGGTNYELMEQIHAAHGLDVAARLCGQQQSRKQDQAQQIYELRNTISQAQELLNLAIRKDSFAVVQNVILMLGHVASGYKYQQLYR